MVKRGGACLAVVLLLLSAPAEAGDLSITIVYTGHETSHYLPHSPACPSQGIGGLGRVAAAVTMMQDTRSTPVLVVSTGGPAGSTPFAWLDTSCRVQLMEQAGYVSLVDSEGNLHAPGRFTPERQGALFSLDEDLTVGVVNMTAMASGDLEATLERLGAWDAHIIVGLHQAPLEDSGEIARQVKGLDVLISSDGLHPSEPVMHVNDTVVIQAMPRLEALGCLELSYCAVDEAWREAASPVFLELDAQLTADPAVQRSAMQALDGAQWWLAEDERSGYGDFFSPVGVVPSGLPHRPGGISPMSNFLVDALRLGVEQLTSEPVQATFLATDIIAGGLAKTGGFASWYDLLWPSASGEGYDGRPGYGVVSFYLTGEEIHGVIEASAWWQRTQGGGEMDLGNLEVDYDPRRTLLIECPWTGFSVPWLRAVQRVSFSDGKDVEEESLYHIAGDYATLRELLRAEKALEQLSFHPRDRAGQPVEDVQTLLLTLGEAREFKVWEAAIHYLSVQSRDTRGLPVVPATYGEIRSPYHITTGPYLEDPGWWLAVVLVLALTVLVVRLQRGLGPEDRSLGHSPRKHAGM